MKILGLSVGDYLQRFLQLWLFWFWAPALDLVAFVSDPYIENFKFPRWIYLAISLLGFVIANIKLFTDQEERIAQLEAEEADVRIHVDNQGLTLPSALDPNENDSFNENGLPTVAFVWADLQVANAGASEGEFHWRVDSKKSSLPSLFKIEETLVGIDNQPLFSELPTPIPGRQKHQIRLTLKLTVTAVEPLTVVRQARSLSRYRIVVAYYTRHLKGNSPERSVVIEGSFEEFRHQLIERWREREYGDLVLLMEREGISARDEEGNTPLLLAARVGHTGIVQALINAKADVSVGNKDGTTPLLAAISGGYVEIARALIQADADVTAGGGVALVRAAWRGFKQIVQLLLARGIDINVVDENGNTALIGAVERGHFEIVQLLIQEGANVNLTDKEGNTPLLSAVHHTSFIRQWEKDTHESIAELLISAGADVMKTNNRGDTALHLHAGCGHNETVKRLILAGADVNKKNSHGYTPLMHMTEPETARILIDHGSDVNSQNVEGYSALMIAASRGLLNMVELLVDAGATVNMKNQYQQTALLFAIMGGHQDVAEYLKERDPSEEGVKDALLVRACANNDEKLVQELISSGANVNVITAHGYPLILTVAEKSPKILKALVAAGADVNAKREYNSTLLHDVVHPVTRLMGFGGEEAALEKTRILLEAKAEVNAVSEYGTTPLIRTVDMTLDHELDQKIGVGQVKVIRLLLQHGADINANNDRGRTALITALINGALTAAKELIEVGANINAKDREGKTAYHYAFVKNYEEILELLRKKGARG